MPRTQVFPCISVVAERLVCPILEMKKAVNINRDFIFQSRYVVIVAATRSCAARIPAEIPRPSLAPQNEVSPQHCKIRVLFRKTLAKYPNPSPNKPPPPHLRQCHPRASRLQPPPPPMLTRPTSVSHLTPANQQLFIRNHSYKYLNPSPIKSCRACPLTFASATPKHLISSLLPQFYRLPLPNPRIRIMFKYKQFIIIGSIITPNSHVLFRVGWNCTMDFKHSLRGLDVFFLVQVFTCPN